MASNILSYILKERTGMTPEEYAEEKVFPFLGIGNDDYEWYVNPDQVQTSFHGLKMNPVALSKLGMLYLQNGMASNNSDPIVDPSWIKRSFTVGDTNTNGTDLFGYIGWWLGTQEKSNPEDTYVSYGFGGQRLAINYATQRVVAILSDTVSIDLSCCYLFILIYIHFTHCFPYSIIRMQDWISMMTLLLSLLLIRLKSCLPMRSLLIMFVEPPQSGWIKIQQSILALI